MSTPNFPQGVPPVPMPASKEQLDAAVASRRHDLTQDMQRSRRNPGRLRRLLRRG